MTCNLWAADNDNIEKILKAAKFGEISTVQDLLNQGVNVNSSHEIEGNTVLHEAVTFGHPEIVALLLKQGANPNQRDKTNRTPLHMVAFTSNDERQYEIAQLLLQNNADPTVRDDDDETPIEKVLFWNECKPRLAKLSDLFLEHKFKYYQAKGMNSQTFKAEIVSIEAWTL
jgi:ankyrin repeat protein